MIEWREAVIDEIPIIASAFTSSSSRINYFGSEIEIDKIIKFLTSDFKNGLSKYWIVFLDNTPYAFVKGFFLPEPPPFISIEIHGCKFKHGLEKNYQSKIIFSKFLEFIWENYNADKLHCEAFEKNRGLRNMVVNAGFELEGVRKKHKLRNGIPENILLFGILNPRKYSIETQIYRSK